MVMDLKEFYEENIGRQFLGVISDFALSANKKADRSQPIPYKYDFIILSIIIFPFVDQILLELALLLPLNQKV